MKAPDFWYRGEAGLAAQALAPLGAVYAAIGRRRIARAVPHRLNVPVICVGNLVAGGAGKTPVALSLLARLRERGANPHALTRGHGGRLSGPVPVDPTRHTAADVGDEPLLLAGAAPVWVARDRVAGGIAAATAGADVVVMDDGFQNPHLFKDLSLVVVDGGVGFGNRRPIPAGPLREHVEHGLARADALVVVGADRAGVAADAERAGIPVLGLTLVPEPSIAEDLRGKAVLAFAGIGRPEKFFRTLDELGARLVETRGFPDHHPFTETEVAGLLERAARLGAIPVTTTKDQIRLPTEARAAVTALPVTASWGDPAALDALLDKLFRRLTPLSAN